MERRGAKGRGDANLTNDMPYEKQFGANRFGFHCSAFPLLCLQPWAHQGPWARQGPQLVSVCGCVRALRFWHSKADFQNTIREVATLGVTVLEMIAMHLPCASRCFCQIAFKCFWEVLSTSAMAWGLRLLVATLDPLCLFSTWLWDKCRSGRLAYFFVIRVQGPGNRVGVRCRGGVGLH